MTAYIKSDSKPIELSLEHDQDGTIVLTANGEQVLYIEPKDDELVLMLSEQEWHEAHGCVCVKLEEYLK
jgi:hypothetical protein